ncbi:polysaccharide deacetylase family protein [uncultured Clostridium sp.]|uniref:polysaccharide deacetylase family protein n=1 Tax=uncultured Clostridium sp. TaxID=59620 RepID=UPI0025E827BA|nr:polysaccharide deacetylase family protein [uncultured Clostridium sp.]MDU4883120.1 polysaccharide deacetylase family protein [Clostridium celatum]MDU7076305.1 polysaccharide deacetylase family protein [Clostridium celatum]
MYKLSKVIIRNSVLIVILLLSFVFGIQTLKKYKIYNKDKEVIANQNISFIDNEVSQNTGEESNDGDLQNRENINTATTKQNLIYTSYENDLYADNAKDVENMLNKWNYLREDGKKVAYLTFDDGPSTEVTQQILETLKFNNIKATFFVLGSNVEKSNIQKELLKEMVIERHAIGNHGYCHDYSILYPSRVANPTVIVNDMKKSEYVMRSVLGDDFRTSVIRLPGGHMSWNTKMLDPVLEENGYSYIDWNTLNGDAEGNDRTVEQLVNRLKGTIRDLAGNDDVLVILMHDTNAKKTTSQSLQEIIDYLKSLGYEFRTLK